MDGAYDDYHMTVHTVSYQMMEISGHKEGIGRHPHLNKESYHLVGPKALTF